MSEAENILLKVNNLKVYFDTSEGEAKAVDGISFEVNIGETLGIVGESGCGKTVTANTIMRLIPAPPGRIVSGQIYFAGRDLTTLSSKEMRLIRGDSISMIFQEPMTSLNPVYSVGNQLIEAIKLHQKLNKVQALKQAETMLDLVGIPSPKQRLKDYPHQLSGGMRQRVMIAMALSCNPKLLIADEPTTALDVTIQAQILDLLNDLKERLNTSIMLITHDLGVIAETAQQVIVMYAGRIVEKGNVNSMFSDPLHPYTRGLLESIPAPDNICKLRRLKDIKGIVPKLTELGNGCFFEPRCEQSMGKCKSTTPELHEKKTGP